MCNLKHAAKLIVECCCGGVGVKLVVWGGTNLDGRGIMLIVAAGVDAVGIGEGLVGAFILKIGGKGREARWHGTVGPRWDGE